ncbi:MAG TPA: hypothetical protein VFA75_00710 [Nevskia sp.]|jgi:hypothetical protein|nr:hypothetical protein [Nevskia sp.]
MDSPHSFFAANLVPSARLVVEADFDPQLPSRVLGRFAEAGRLPTRFVAHNVDDERLRVEVEFAAEPDAARHLSRRLLNVPSVRSVELSFRRARIGRAAAA